MDRSQMDDKQLNEALEAEPTEPQTEAPKEDKAKVESDAEKPTQPDAASTPTLESVQAELTKLQKQLAEKDKFNGRLTNELGQLRKQMSAPKKDLPPEPTDDDILTKPKESIKALQARKEAEDQEAKAKQDEQIRLILEANQNVVYTTVPDFDDNKPHIEKMLVEEDKLDPKMVQGFLSNPFYADPVVLIQMARRSATRTELTKLSEENKTLKEQIASLKKKPGQVLDQLEKTAKAGPTIKGKSEPAKSGQVSDAQRAAMSYEQLQEALKNSEEE